MSSKQNVIAQALELSDAERLEIAEALFQSLDGPPDADADAAWAAEIGRRVNDLDAGRAKVVKWPEARRQIAGDDDGGATG
jgi:putative addiction module component (TIGR02574 family)